MLNLRNLLDLFNPRVTITPDQSVGAEGQSLAGRIVVSDPSLLGTGLLGSGLMRVEVLGGQIGTISLSNDRDARSSVVDLRYTYVPDAAKHNALTAGQVFEETFTVRAIDGSGRVAETSFTLKFTGANDAPVLEAPQAITLTDTSVNDDFTQPPAARNLTGQLVATDADNSVLTYGIQNGTLSADGTRVTSTNGFGTLEVVVATGAYTFTAIDAAVEAVGERVLSETFTVTAFDGVTTGTAALKLNITGANDAPVLEAPQAITLTDTSVNDDFTQPPAARNLTGQLVATDADNSVLTYGIQNGTLSADGTRVTSTNDFGTLEVVVATGSYAFTVTDDAVEALGDVTVSEMFEVTVSDGLVTRTAQLNLNITGAEDAPKVTGPADNNETSFLVTSSEDGTLRLRAGDVFLGDTINLTANQAATVNVAAQAVLTSAVAVVSDADGNTTLGSTALTLGSDAGESATGTSGSDLMYGFAGNDVLSGGEGNDTIYGGAGLDNLTGGGGDDTIKDADGVAILRAGDGNDIVEINYAASFSFAATGVTRGSHFLGGSGDDIITLNFNGNNFGNALNFGSDNSTAGTESVASMNDGNDTVVINGTRGGVGVFTFVASGGNDTITVNGTIGSALYLLGAGQDRFNGGAAGESVSGGAGADVISGGAGNDTFIYRQVPTGDPVATSAAGLETAMVIGGDTVSDFEGAGAPGGDVISLSRAAFALTSVAGNGFSVGTEFASVANDDAVDGSAARIVFSQSSGSVFFNASGGADDAAVLVTLTGVSNLTAADFTLVNS